MIHYAWPLLILLVWPHSVTNAEQPGRAGVTTILPHAKQQPGSWHYTFETPEKDWFAAGYDDANWKRGDGAFGTTETPNTHVGTVWDTEEIWLRRSFEVKKAFQGQLYLLAHHDEDTTVYINGVLAGRAAWFNTDFDMIPVERSAAATLKPGVNTIAVHCRQTYGGQYIDVGIVAVVENRWSREKAREWFRDRPWPCGFNYIPANAISYTEMWMPYSFNPELIEKELALAEKIGFNCLRVVLPFVVWEHDPEAFKKRLDAFLEICDRRGINVMFALFDDCHFGSDEKLRNPTYGKQPDVLVGWYANGWTPSPGHAIVRNTKQWPRLEKYVTDVVGTFKDDPRVWVWDLYNEPTNSGLGKESLSLVENVFHWARRVEPIQPLTVGQWNGNAALNAVIFRNSDIITFHDYSNADSLARHIASLMTHGRPIINTEWLNRGHGSVVETCLPIFVKQNVGCMHWGLVNGKTQTHLNWGHRPGQPDPPAWQHDLFHGDHRPYDPLELNLFRDAIHRQSTDAEK